MGNERTSGVTPVGYEVVEMDNHQLLDELLEASLEVHSHRTSACSTVALVAMAEKVVRFREEVERRIVSTDDGRAGE